MSSDLPSTQPNATPAEPPADDSVAGSPPTIGDGVPPPASSPGLPGYDIIGVLGRGAMGVVYHARQVALKRDVAVKMILAGGHAGEQERKRFLAEAEVIASIQHPGVVQVFDYGTQDGLPYFVMEFCPGGALADRLNGKPIPEADAARLVASLADAVHAAHEKGVVHRDLKPGNVLLTADGSPKVADFGLARQADGSRLTATGAIMGTPAYMAPEQARGLKAIGPAADVYALGTILYECLTGRVPFKGETSHDTMMRVISEEPFSPRALTPGVSRDLEAVCLRCLQKDPARRYGSAKELAADLRRFLVGERVMARPWGWAWYAWAAFVLWTLGVAGCGRLSHSLSVWEYFPRLHPHWIGKVAPVGCVGLVWLLVLAVLATVPRLSPKGRRTFFLCLLAFVGGTFVAACVLAFFLVFRGF
jgi:serine/threonine-protein kinase